MANYFLPGYSGEVPDSDTDVLYSQSAPLYNLYSPRLFGAPPQLTNLCDMRLKSSMGTTEGPVGDFYLDNVLRSAQIANIIVGHALFNGDMSGFASLLRSVGQYAYALSKYSVYGQNGEVNNRGAAAAIANEYDMEAYNKAIGEDTGDIPGMKRASEIGNMTGADDDAYMLDISEIEGADQIMENLASMFEANGTVGTAAGLLEAFKTAKGMQQAYYVFEADWSSYINNVIMMINSAVMMLGLNDAKVKIGGQMFSIAAKAHKDASSDVWTNYRFITPTSKVGRVNALDTLLGDTNQYVSFMIEPVTISESYTNSVGESQIYSTVINQGSSIGNEIAFITNTSRSAVDDALIGLTSSAINIAERIMQNLTLGTGRFTAAILGSMGRSYTGDHTIFPEIFQKHDSTKSVTLSIKLRATGGDPYSYLIDILVPLFHLIAMAIPQMSKNAASAYSYPPVIQLNIPGVWGTRLGMITSLQVEKNADGTDFSVNGYPLSVNVNVTVADLQHVLMSSQMDQPGRMLNNSTMFDYIAQCAGVDKYRINGSIRVVTRIALAAASGGEFLYNLGNAVLNDLGTKFNRFTGNAR